MYRLPYRLAMSFACLLPLLFSPASAQVGGKLEDLKETEIFTKYEMEEAPEAAMDMMEMMKELTVYRPKSGEHREQITMVLHVDSLKTVRSINLSIDRNLINKKQTAKFAAEVTVTFLRSVVPEEDLEKFSDLINQILWPRGVVYPPDVERPMLPDYPTADYITYLGKNKIYVKSYPHTAVHLENMATEEMAFLSISLMPL